MRKPQCLVLLSLGFFQCLWSHFFLPSSLRLVFRDLEGKYSKCMCRRKIILCVSSSWNIPDPQGQALDSDFYFHTWHLCLNNSQASLMWQTGGSYSYILISTYSSKYSYMPHCSSSVWVDGPILSSGTNTHHLALISSPSLPLLLTTHLSRSYHLCLQDVPRICHSFVAYLVRASILLPWLLSGLSLVPPLLFHFCLSPMYTSLCFVFSHSVMFSVCWFLLAPF